MKRIVLLYILLTTSLCLTAQKYFITNLYVYDLFVMNPANAGADKDCYEFGMFYQNQWLGIDESPTTQIIHAQGPLTKNLGFGSYIYNDRNGNMKELGIHQAFSYEVFLKKSKRNISSLSFGLAFSLEQSSVDKSGFVNNSSVIDPVVTGGVTNGIGYNANAGIIYKYNNHFLGYSATNLFNQTNPMYLNNSEPELPIDNQLFFGSIYKVVDRDIYLEPIVMYRWNNYLDKKLDITLRGTFPTPNPDYALWGLVSYRRDMDNDFGTSLGLATTVGVNYRAISFGLEYQLGLTGAQVEYGSAYQVVLKYSICNMLKHSAIPCSEARKNKKSRYKGVIWY